MDNALLPTETSGATRSLRSLCYAILVLFTLATAVVGVVKGMDAGRSGLIFVAIMLLPLLGTTVMQLRWTHGEAIDERLGRLANFSAVMLVGMDIALMVVMLQKQATCPACPSS